MSVFIIILITCAALWIAWLTFRQWLELQQPGPPPQTAPPTVTPPASSRDARQAAVKAELDALARLPYP